MFFVGTEKLMDVKVKALQSFASQQQLDMDVFRQLGAVAYRQHIHHRVVGGWVRHGSEMFRVQRSIEFGSLSYPDRADSGHRSRRCGSSS
ncbi:PIG-L family deacetylase OS=Streptomyces microflavus OX=1919 GN=Smic_04920 PE=4 SV=1 [Streptomyces microflavus]